MVGGPLLLLVAVLTAVRSTTRAILHGRPPSLPAALGLTAVLVYAGPVRRWMRSWGARPGEATAKGPLHAIEVEAPREAVWPWLAQIGQDRGGFYSYEWLENLAGCRMRNAEHIQPEWQHREIGDKVMLHPLNGLPVSRFEPGHELALEGWAPSRSSRSMRPAAAWCVAASPTRASPSPSITRSSSSCPTS